MKKMQQLMILMYFNLQCLKWYLIIHMLYFLLLHKEHMKSCNFANPHVYACINIFLYIFSEIFQIFFKNLFVNLHLSQVCLLAESRPFYLPPKVESTFLIVYTIWPDNIVLFYTLKGGLYNISGKKCNSCQCLKYNNYLN